MPLELTEGLLSKAAGWEAMKHARALVAQGHVLSSYWAAPLLRGVVQSGDQSFRASLVIKTEIDVENLCNCREAREWGKICAHSVAVGLHWLNTRRTPPQAHPQGSETNHAPPVARSKGWAVQRSDVGEEAEVYIILPPNLQEALARGKIMVVVEAKWTGGRCPLNALPKGRTFAFSKVDTVVLERLERLANGQTPAVLQLTSKEFASLLPALVEHPNISLGKKAEVKVFRQPLVLPIRAVLESDGQIVLSLKQTPPQLRTVENWVWETNSFRPFALSGGLSKLLNGPIRITRAQVPQFLSQDWPRLACEETTESNFTLADFVLQPQPPRFVLELRGGLAQLTALLQCAYGARIMTIGVTATDESFWLPDPEVSTRYSTRDLAGERAALARLQRCGFAGPDSQGKLQLLGQDPVLNFFAREYPKLQREWSVSLEERLAKSTSQKLERIEPQFQITPSGVQWFDLGVVFSASGGEVFSPAEIQRLLLSGQSHTRLKSGRFAVINTEAVEEFQEVLRDCAPQQHGQGYRINNQQAGFLEATLQQHQNWRVKAPERWKRQAARQTGQAAQDCPSLGDLDSVLRPYQKQGVAWLLFLRQNNFGGILADEMGLGKTLQALAFLRHTRQSQPGLPPVLIVCPTSVVYNWVAEAARFTPTLRVLALQGATRQELFAKVPEHDLVITSYALIRRDAERYRDYEFDTVVLDEAQHIKNRQTQNAQAVKAIQAPHRIGTDRYSAREFRFGSVVDF